MSYHGKERRRYQRYDMEAKMHFYVDYELQTRIKFQVDGENKDRAHAGGYKGVSRNVSANGLRFSSDKKLKKGDKLHIDLYLPKRQRPILMTGQVRWSEKFYCAPSAKYRFDTGVKLLTIKGRSVRQSIYFDREYHVFWSKVLDSVFGGFRKSLRLIQNAMGMKK